MALVTVHLRLVKPQGKNDIPDPATGRVDFVPAAHGKYHNSLRTVEKVTSQIDAEGEMIPVELTPALWKVTITPTKGNPWPEMLFELTEGMPEPVNLADLLPETVVDGAQLAKGDPGPIGPQGEPGPEGPRGPQGEKGDGSSWAELTGKPALVDVGRKLTDEDLDTFTQTAFLTQASAPSATLARNYPVEGRAVHVQVIGSDDRYVIQIATPLVGSSALPWYWRTKFGSEWKPWQAVPSFPITEADGLQATINRLACDSGWRDITSLLDPDYLALNPNSTVYIRRSGSEVTMNFSQGTGATATGLYPVVLLLPAGFRTSRDGRPWGSPGLDQQTGKQVIDGSGIYLDTSGWRVNLNATPGKRYAFTMRWTTHEDPPATLPGDPA